MDQHLKNVLSSAHCFLWDFDGCFADTEKLHFLSYHEAFGQFGHDLSEADYYPSFTHLGEGTGREITKHGLKVSENEVAVLKSAAYGRLIRQGPVSCFPETLRIVRCMRGRGAKVAIASNSSEEEIKAVLTTAGFPLTELDLIVGKNPSLRKKPAPDIFLHALSLLGCTADATVVLEDSSRGLQSAAAARCQAVWIRTRYNEGLTSSEPHMGSLSHAQLLEFFQSLKS